jgi:hypothetical protein
MDLPAMWKAVFFLFGLLRPEHRSVVEVTFIVK